ncbi:MAG: hypothetical protein AB1779_08940, partial [Candidatus Thermoplasmatota archaeon]
NRKNAYKSALEKINSAKFEATFAKQLKIKTKLKDAIISAEKALESGKYDFAFDIAKNSIDEQAKEKEELFKKMMKEMEGRISKNREIGAFVASAEDRLKRAVNALECNDYCNAFSLYDEGLYILSESERRFEDVRKILNVVDEKMSICEKMGGETTNVKKITENIWSHIKRNDYDKAIAVAENANDEIETVLQEVCVALIERVEENIGKAKEAGIETTTLESILVEIKAYLENAEYLKVSEKGKSAIEEALKSMRNTCLETISLAKKKLEEIKEMGLAIENFDLELKKIDDLFKIEEYLDAIKNGKDTIERIYEEEKKLVSNILDTCITLALETEALEIDVSGINKDIADAKEKIKNEEYRGAYEILLKVMDDCERLRAEEAKSKIKRCDVLIGGARDIKIDVTEFEGLLENAKIALKKKDYENAISSASLIIRGMEEEQEKGIRERIEMIASNIKLAKEMELDVFKQEELLEQVKKHVENKNYVRGYSLSEKVNRSICSLIDAKILKMVDEEEERIREGEKIGADVHEAIDLLSDSREAVRTSEYESAIELIEKSAKIGLEAKVKVISTLIDSLEGSIEEAKEFGCDVSSFTPKLAEAKKLLDDGAYTSAHDFLLKALEECDNIKEEVMDADIKAGEKVLSVIAEMEMDKTKFERLFKRARDEKDKKDYEKAFEYLRIARETSNKIINEGVSTWLSKADKAIKDVKIDVNISNAKALFEEAKNSLNEKEFMEALDFAKQSIAEVKKAQDTFINEKISSLNSLLREFEKIKVDVLAIKNAIIDATEFLSKEAYESALDRVNEAFAIGDKIYQDVISEKIEECNKLLISPQIECEIATDLLKQSKTLLENKNYSDAYSFVLQAIEEIEKAQEYNALENISSAEDFITETKKENREVILTLPKELLQKAKAQLDKKEYAEVLVLVKKSKEETKKTLNAFLAATNAIKTIYFDILKAKESKIEVREVEELLEKAEVEIKRGSYKEANEYALNAKEKLNGAFRDSANESLRNAQAKVTYAKNIGADITDCEKLLEDAKMYIGNKDYKKGYEISKNVAALADKAREKYKEIIDIIYSADSVISIGKNYGLDMTTAEKLIHQALLLKSRNADEALEFAKQGKEEASKAIERFTPHITIDIKTEETLTNMVWSKGTIVLINDGQASARDLIIKAAGNMEIEGLEGAVDVKGNDTKVIQIRIKPNKSGDLPIKFNVEYIREFDGKKFTTQEVKWLKVIEGIAEEEVKVEPAVRKAIRCYICLGSIKPTLPLVRCVCGKTYHESCANRVMECPNCNRVIISQPK